MTGESGRGDPERTLELLWGTREPAARGPKPGLTIEQIVEAAIGLADADGLDALSMRRLAGELGVGTMSLYRYVPAKAELVDLMLDALNREVAAPDGSKTGWRELLEHYAREGWALLQRHPWAATAQTRPVLGPNTLDAYEAVLSAAAGTGLEPADVLNAAELVSGYVDGAARRLAEAAETQRRTGVTDEQWWTERESLWERYFDVERYPMITAMWEADAFDARADAFEFGLQRVLDGIEAYIAG